MTDKPTERTVDRFYVENPNWTYGRKLVVLASDYDQLHLQYEIVRGQLDREREKSAEWERTARMLRERGRLSVVKVK